MLMTETLYWYLMIFVGIMGLSVGSFLNVVIYRVPAGRSIAFPGSACGSCGHPVRAYDNIPILSWLLLRGKCRDCKAPISARYAGVEALTGILAVFTWWQIPDLLGRVGLPYDKITLGLFATVFALRFAFLALLVVITFIDLDHYIIPHRFPIMGMILGLLSPWILQWFMGIDRYLAMWPPMMPIMSLVGLIGGGLLIVVVFYVYLMVRGVMGIGGGDVTLMAMVGAWLGIPGIIFVCFAASLQGILAVGVTTLFGVSFVTDARKILGEDLESEPAITSDSPPATDATSPASDAGEVATDATSPASDAAGVAADATSPASDAGEVAADATSPASDAGEVAATGASETPRADGEGGDAEEGLTFSNAAIPFGPFIALAAVEYMLFGIWFPAPLSMIQTFFLFY